MFFVSEISTWIPETFGEVTFSQAIFTINTSVEGTENTIIYSFIYNCILLSLLYTAILFIFLETLICIGVCWISKLKIKIKFKNKFKLNYDNLIKKITIVLYILIMILIYTRINKVGTNIGFFDYIKYNNQTTNIYEDYYVDASKIDFDFPEEKRNLIYINVESLETTLFEKSNGGKFDKNYTPYLFDLAKEEINFSQKYDVGGFRVVDGSSWTVAGLTSQLMGVPLNVPIDGNSYGNDNFLPGSYGLTDILEDNDYNTLSIMGSDASFGNRDSLLQGHGINSIIDLFEARKLDYIADDYSVWWGYEDSILFDIAQQELQKLSEQEEPFFLHLLTADTHFIDGYLDNSCSVTGDPHLLNVYSCADIMLEEFITYLSLQDYYDNTTIVIAGDHLNMNQVHFNIDDEDNITRRGYYTIINGNIDEKVSTNREYTSFDLLPTTLNSMGITWDGNKIALGTSLFSEEETLIEIMGFDKLNSELLKNSDYYNDNILN